MPLAGAAGAGAAAARQRRSGGPALAARQPRLCGLRPWLLCHTTAAARVLGCGVLAAGAERHRPRPLAALPVPRGGLEVQRRAVLVTAAWHVLEAGGQCGPMGTTPCTLQAKCNKAARWQRQAVGDRGAAVPRTRARRRHASHAAAPRRPPGPAATHLVGGATSTVLQDPAATAAARAARGRRGLLHAGALPRRGAWRAAAARPAYAALRQAVRQAVWRLIKGVGLRLILRCRGSRALCPHGHRKQRRLW
jgi:hypothetical protein